MKRIFFIRARAFRHLILIISAFILTQTLAAQNQNAVIRELQGTVELQRAGSTNWVAARAGDRIETDTIISTGFRSSAILAVGNSTLTVRPVTRLSLAELTTQNNVETTSINLNTGRVRVEVTPPAGTRANVSVKTATATASVRGTTFEMDPVSLKVIEGVVSFAPANSTRAVTVSAGQTTQVNTDTGAALSPMAAAETATSLPSLPGQQSGASVADTGSFVPAPALGSLGIDNIILKPRQPGLSGSGQ